MYIACTCMYCNISSWIHIHVSPDFIGGRYHKRALGWQYSLGLAFLWLWSQTVISFASYKLYNIMCWCTTHSQCCSSVDFSLCKCEYVCTKLMWACVCVYLPFISLTHATGRAVEQMILQNPENSKITNEYRYNLLHTGALIGRKDIVSLAIDKVI